MQTHVAHKNTEETIQNTWVQLVHTTWQHTALKLNLITRQEPQEPLRLLVEVSGKGPVKPRLTVSYLAVRGHKDLWWLSFCRYEYARVEMTHLTGMTIHWTEQETIYIKILFDMLLSDATTIKLLLHFMNFGILFYDSKP